MPKLYLTPASISYLNQIILALVITLYFTWLKIKHGQKHDRQTSSLLVLFASITLFSSLLFLDAALSPSQRLLAVYTENTALALVLVALIQLAFYNPEPHQRASVPTRVMFALAIAYLVFETIVAIGRCYLLLAQHRVVLRADYLDFLPAFGLVLITLLVLFNTIRHWNLPANRNFALIFLVPFWLAIVNILRTFNFIPTWFYHINFSVGILLTLFLFALNYVVSLPEITSFTVKILGILLTSMLAILGIVAWIVTPAYATHYVPRLRDHRTLHITPNNLGGYDIAEIPFHFDHDLGTKLNLVDAGTYRPSAQVDFPFPFFGKTYSSLFVMDDGAISMGQPLDYRDLQYHFSSQAVLLPLLLDLAPDPATPRAVYLKRQADSIIVTYNHIPAFSQPQDIYTFQVILYSNGQFEITYDGLPLSIQYQVDDNPLAAVWAVGFKPAGGSPRTADFSSLPLASGGSGLIQDEFLSFRTYIHLFLLPLGLSILTSSLILIIGIPLLLRFTLLHPLNALLEGVQAMNLGKHGITIPVEANDEIGYLTESFNHMSAQLNGLITDLENRVIDRTSELRESEKQYRELFDLESDAIFIIRNSDGQILQANNAAIQLYGFSLAEMLNKRNTDLSAEPEETQKATNSPFPSDQIVRIPLRWHRKKNGEVFPVSITARFI